MARSENWLINVRPEEAAAPIAQRVVRKRLQKVWRLATRAVQGHDEDGEKIHQLRIATRRAATALDVFSQVLPAPTIDWFAKRIKRLRRAAGEARDVDVLYKRLADPKAPADETGLHALLDLVEGQRLQARKPLQMAFRRIGKSKFKGHAKDVCQSTKEHALDEKQESYEEIARHALGRIAEPFLLAARGDCSDLESLHALRIRGKQLRYAVELFPSVLDADAVAGAEKLLTEIHARLGALHDHVTMVHTLTEMLQRAKRKPLRALLQRLLQREELQLHATHHEYCHWWSERRLAGLRKSLDPLLKSRVIPVGKRKRKSS